MTKESEIPIDCVREILSRVPAEPLLRFRCVCKAWRQAIDDPEFIKSHLQKQSSDGDQLLIRKQRRKQLYAMSLDSLNDSDHAQSKPISATPIKHVSHSATSVASFLPVSTCNGLILVPGKIWMLWNPVTHESRELSPPFAHSIGLVYKESCGLGYDSAADDYKIVSIIPHSASRTRATSVYSLKSNSFRRIMDFPRADSWSSKGVGRGLFLKGALHWLDTSKLGRTRIIVLDIETENYRVMSPPPQIADHVNLEVLGGCLVVSCYYSQTDYFKGWIMNEYGVSDSWTELFSFSKQQWCRRARPLAYLKSKGLVLFHHDKGFLWFDIEKKTAREVLIDRGPLIFSSQVFSASLVRLNSIGGGVCDSDSVCITAEDTASRKRKRGNNRLKLHITTTDATKGLLQD